HVPLDVLHNDDGVVDHHADRQHDAKQCQEVDRESHGEHPWERADQCHEDGYGADDRGAEALQEQVDHKHHEHDRLEERDRKSTRLNSSHTEIYTLSLHDALPISDQCHEDGYGADDRGAEALQEQVDHKHHEHDRLEE